MRYKLVEWESEEYGPVKDRNLTILEGVIEDALVVQVKEEMLHRLISLGPNRLQGFVDQTRKALRESGWEGEIMVCSDDMKFARFEPVEPMEGRIKPRVERSVGHVQPPPDPEPETASDPEPAPLDEVRIPSLDEVWARQSQGLQEMRAEIDRGIIRDIMAEEAKVCPHCGDPGCAGAEYDPGDCPEAP